MRALVPRARYYCLLAPFIQLSSSPSILVNWQTIRLISATLGDETEITGMPAYDAAIRNTRGRILARQNRTVASAYRSQLPIKTASTIAIRKFYVFAAMSFSHSRASSPTNCTVADVPADQVMELNAHMIRHSKYYFDDGNILFQVSV